MSLCLFLLLVMLLLDDAKHPWITAWAMFCWVLSFA